MGTHKESIKLTIKAELIGWFRSAHSREGDMLSPDWLHDTYLPTLSLKEEKAFEEAVGEMIVEGLLGYVKDRRPSYRLTKKGEELL